MNIAELAAYVCTHLNNSGIKCILTGGACVSVYTDNKFESFDLDFLIVLILQERKFQRYWKRSALFKITGIL